jgi:hypothetical protein
MNITRTAFAAGTLLAGAAAVAACSAPTVSKTAQHVSNQGGNAGSAPTAIFTPTPPSPTAAPATSGPLGTSFTVTTTDEQGAAVVYTVTAVKVDQHTGLGPYETLNNASDHMAAVRFTITGVTGQENDDANSDADVTGSDTNEYQFSAIDVTAGPNFSSGDFEVGPGQTVSGWVAFELPAGATVASVSWEPGFDSPAATWTLS